MGCHTGIANYGYEVHPGLVTTSLVMSDRPPDVTIAGVWPIPTGKKPLPHLKAQHRHYGKGGRVKDEAKLGIAPPPDSVADYVRLGPNGTRACTHSSPDPYASALRIQVQVGAPRNLIENIHLSIDEKTGAISKTSAESWANQFTQTGLTAAAWMLFGVTWIVSHTLNRADGMYKLEKSVAGMQTFAYLIVPTHDKEWPHHRPEIPAMLTSLYGQAMATRIIMLVRATDPRRWRIGGKSRKNARTTDDTSESLAKAMGIGRGKKVMLPGAACPGVSFKEIFHAVSVHGGLKYEAFTKHIMREVHRIPFPAAVAAALFTRVPLFLQLTDDEKAVKAERRAMMIAQGNVWLLSAPLANSMQGIGDENINPSQQVRACVRRLATTTTLPNRGPLVAGPTAVDCNIACVVQHRQAQRRGCPALRLRGPDGDGAQRSRATRARPAVAHVVLGPKLLRRVVGVDHQARLCVGQHPSRAVPHPGRPERGGAIRVRVPAPADGRHRPSRAPVRADAATAV